MKTNSLKDREKYTTQMLTKREVEQLISSKEDFRTRNITRDIKTHHIMIKRAVFREALQILNLFAPNNRASKHMRQKLIDLKEEIDNP